MDITLLLSIVFTGLSILPLAAHLLELPNKLGLSKAEYTIAQKLYRGWAVSGFVELPAIILGSILAAQHNWTFLYVLAAISLIVAHLIFWMFTFPANKKTNNWTHLGNN